MAIEKGDALFNRPVHEESEASRQKSGFSSCGTPILREEFITAARHAHERSGVRAQPRRGLRHIL
jgi:hypothetical protein